MLNINDIHSLLSIRNASLKLPLMERPILEDINLNLNAGDFLIVLGGNGSGKSSLIRLLNQRFALSSGTLQFNQNDLSTLNHAHFSQSVVTIDQDPANALFFELTVIENCLLTESRYKPSQSSMTKFSMQSERKFYATYLQDFHSSLSFHLDTPVHFLSGGEKQALILALAVLEPPKLLLLDEHTSALDPHQAQRMMECTQRMIQQHNMTALMTTHHLDHALEYGDRLIALKDGKIIFEANYDAKQQLTRQDLLEFCY